MSFRNLIVAASAVSLLAAGAVSAQPVASKPVPNPPAAAHAHKTVIVKHRHGKKIVKVVRHHHGKTTVTKKVTKG